MPENTITDIEMMASRAWPPEETERVGGWYLRASRGVTRRANSVLPAGPLGNLSLDTAISHAVRFYQERHLPTIFQMTDASQPADLDARLEEMGFARELVVHVQTGELTGIAFLPDTAAVHIRSAPTDTWLRTYAAAEGYDRKSTFIRKQIILRISGPRAFASATQDRRTVGVGLGVVEGPWVGFFAVATLGEYRRRGTAKSVISALAQWALQNGAKNVYLQVESRNEPALKMYKSVGFRTLYTYWYRILKT